MIVINIDLSNFLPTILGAFLSILGGFLQQKYSEKKSLELNEQEIQRKKLERIRDEKISIIKQITSNKTAIAFKSPDHNATTSFNSAINLVPLVFQDNELILKKHSDLFSSISEQDGKEDNLFYELMVLLYEDVDFIPPTREQLISTFLA